ncbi:unnamed protein product [Effrenium voratum]|uniref:PARP catalytic domain-containing protein n=2 Tax=Effrenium voratum TaxID=2562239 RepID=A0AA36MNF0_9DINO|nr:unnamed protein product [Effrenium voratum]CAJ1445963.1 unnamed protein product [Effrenium voratum]CAJ1462151.1 unnamed protein product [Effrenium voratum]
MGDCQTKEQVTERLEAEEEQLKRDFELSLEALKECDQLTRVPHLLIEIRSLGFVEIQGKDTGGIYQKLDSWLKQHWRATEKTQDLILKCAEEQTCGCCGFAPEFAVGTLEPHHALCDKSYTLGEMSADGKVLSNHTYKNRGSEGENNMGKLTMQLAQFLTNECGWTLQVCDSGNLGWQGEIREQQMKFKAPHPLNLIAPLVMIELRQVGYIEINGQDQDGIYGKLGNFCRTMWQATQTQADRDYCDLKFKTSAFKGRGSEGENNMGQRTMELVDFMVKQCQWTMVTCNTGNFGRRGDKREQQLIFRNDEFVQHGVDHIMIELRTAGYIEINGLHDAKDLQPELINFMVQQWRCKEYTKYMWESSENFCDLKYTAPDGLFTREGLTNNLGKRTIELADFLAQHGWALLLCNGGSVTPNPSHSPNNIIREQQVKFTRTTPEKAKAPLLMIELRTVPYSDGPPAWYGYIEICGKDTNGVHGHLDRFITHYMHGNCIGRGNVGHCDVMYSTTKFRKKPSSNNENGRYGGYMNGESNIGKWTMRLCDFMVDHLGEWDLIVCNSDNLDRSFQHGSGDNKYFNSVTAREMQLVFRHKAGGRGVFMSASNVEPLGRPPLQPPPYWKDAGCKDGTVGHKLVPGTPEELTWMQEILDGTFKNKVTRDRKDGQPLADRFVAVQCVRSEHPGLWDRFAERRGLVAEAGRSSSDFVEPKTMAAAPGLARRCVHASVGNPANQAYLLHGTNPTSAVAILQNSFTVDFAGKSAGTMFGPGVYLAESSTKADEYARDDAGGEYDGLYALLVCKAVLGRSYVTEKAGDFRDQVLSGEYGHVLGDREKAVGTFREFIFFHEASIYPEFAVFYRREKDGKVMARPERELAPAMMEMEGEVASM